jgi:hypothetical protein
LFFRNSTFPDKPRTQHQVFQQLIGLK